MPKKVLPTSMDLRRIVDELVFSMDGKRRGFYPVQGLEHFHKTTKDERAVAPRPRKGAELGFVFQKNDLAVVVWTSWLLAEAAAREKDCGWVVIEEAGKGVYYIPLHRTRNFTARLLMEAKIARCRVRHRPSCSVCGKPMSIVRGEGAGSRYWRCPKGCTRETWDTKPFLADLPAGAKQYLRRRRKQRERWYAVCRSLGNPIRQAMFFRKAWEIIKLPIAGF